MSEQLKNECANSIFCVDKSYKESKKIKIAKSQYCICVNIEPRLAKKHFKPKDCNYFLPTNMQVCIDA